MAQDMVTIGRKHISSSGWHGHSGVSVRRHLCLTVALSMMPVAALAAQSTTAAAVISLRERPHHGDFQPGDRILLTLRTDSTFTDTLTVQADRSIIVQKLPPISLVGIDRAALQPYLSAQVQHFIKGEVIAAKPFLRLGILGQVVHPGFYRVPVGIGLGDALMVAGGPSPQADLTHITVRRGTTTILDARRMRQALVAGAPLDEIDVDAGDEILVGEKRSVNWMLISQVAGLGTGLVLALHALKVF
jgi:protein involved in polysaccharide export with SLBB domain